MATNFTQQLRVRAGEKVKLGHYDPDDTLDWKKNREMKDSLKQAREDIDHWQYLLSAERKQALLIVLQGLDTAGKDGVIRHVMSGVNPQGCQVASFKAPSAEEAAHDFLWRVHKAVPERGQLGIFNRSHYEDVLVARVHNLVPRRVWALRYDQINAFESILEKNQVTILKFYLHISRSEQNKRLLARLDDPDKRWKISEADFKEKKFWDAYQTAYEDVLTKCNTPAAPWFIIPANKKWFRNLAISHIIAETMARMGLKLPKPQVEVRKLENSLRAKMNRRRGMRTHS